MAEECKAYFDVEGPISLFKAVFSGQLCSSESVAQCSICGKGRCSNHLIRDDHSGRLVCLTDRPEQCRPVKSSAQTPPTQQSMDSATLPSIPYAQSCSDINRVNSELGKGLQQLAIEALRPFREPDLRTALQQVDIDSEAARILFSATARATLETSNDSQQTYRRLRPLLMEWGYDPAGPLKFVRVDSPLPRSPEEVEPFRKAAEAGDVNHQYQYGRMLQEGIGIPAQPVQAVSWYRKAAERGHTPAQYQLALMYDEGIGIERDQTQARSWYAQAASRGDSDAQCNLAILCLNGQGGSVDLKTAINLLTSASRQGNIAAQATLASCYDNGRGVSKDPASAFELYLSVASSTESHPAVASAQYNVAIAYLNGDGVAREVSKATTWLQRAASKGHVRSRQVLSSLRA
jgi:TPR repeat protein